MPLSFCTPQMVFDYLSGATPLRLDESSDLSLLTTRIQQKIDDAAQDLIAIVEDRIGANGENFTLPTEEPDPITNEWLFLELLNALPVVVWTINQRSEITNLALTSFGRAQKRTSDALYRRLQEGAFDTVWLNLPLSAVTLATAAQCAEDLNVALGASTRPSLATATRFALRETAVVRAIAAGLGYPQTGSLTDAATAGYRRLVINRVKPYLYRLRAPVDVRFDPRVAELLDEAEEELTEFASGITYSQFRSAA